LRNLWMSATARADACILFARVAVALTKSANAFIEIANTKSHFRCTEVNMHVFRLRTHVLSLVIFAYFAAGAALAQNQTQPQSTKPPATSTTTMEDVSKWTQKQWDAAKAKWSEEKAKWGDCQKQSTKAKLSGRKSWQFLYDCMTK
jgi:hypothetical protein